MLKCPNCGTEYGEGYYFCKQCGMKLGEVNQSQAGTEPSVEDLIRNIVIKRFDSIKNKDENTIKTIISENYSKFDEWPPYLRVEAPKALQNELTSLKVTSDYSYELSDFEANVLGDLAVATFTLNYKGKLRNKPFEINSRVTSIIRKEDSTWKIIHEHLSQFPEDVDQQVYGQFRRHGGFPF